MSTFARKIDFSELPEIAELANDLVLKKVLTTLDSSGALSITWVEINGSHEALISHSQLRIYLVISGNLSVTVSGSNVYSLGKNDVFTLSRGSRYSLTGAGEYVVMNLPAFEEGDDEYFDDYLM